MSPWNGGLDNGYARSAYRATSDAEFVRNSSATQATQDRFTRLLRFADELEIGATALHRVIFFPFQCLQTYDLDAAAIVEIPRVFGSKLELIDTKIDLYQFSRGTPIKPFDL